MNPAPYRAKWRDIAWEAACMAQIGRRVRKARRSIPLSQRVLADRLGTYKPYISKIEHGRSKISAVTLIRLAWALGVSPVDLCPRIER